MFKLYRLFLLALAALFVLTACGGGGGAPLPNPTPTPTACTEIFDQNCNGIAPRMQRTEAVDNCVIDPSSCSPSIPDEVLPCLGDLFGNACDGVTEMVEAVLLRTDIPARRTPELATSLNVLRSELVQTCTDNPNKRQNGSPCAAPIVKTCVDNPFEPQCTNTQSAWVPQVWDYARKDYCTSANNMFYRDCLDDSYGGESERQTFCRSNLGNSDCTMTISRFCGDNANDIFDGLCNTGYDTERGMACANTANSAAALALDSRCGDENSGLLATYCASVGDTAPARIHCPQRIRQLALDACTNNRFGTACDRPEDLVGRISACRSDLNANGLNGCDETVITVCENGYHDGTNDIVANPFDSDLCGVGTASYRAERITACNNDNVPAPLNRGTVCTTPALMAAVCGANDEPFNLIICGADDGVSNLANRQTFCRSNLSDGNCTQTISRFCGDNANDIFDGLCNTGYDTERGMACANTANPAVALALDSRCGSEDSGLLATYCASVGDTAPARIHCPQRVRQLALDACTNNRFGPACDRPEDLVGRISACRSDLNANGSGGCDETVITVCENGYHNGTDNIPANPFDSDLCGVGTASYRAERITACNNNTVPAPLNRGTVCTTPALMAAVCGASDEPFNLIICGADDGVSNLVNRQTFCRTNFAALKDSTCALTIDRFCDTPANPNDIFNRLCDDGYDLARGTRCASAATSSGANNINPNCGTESSGGFITTYCATDAGDTDDIHCSNKVRGLALDACTNNRFGPACDRPEDLVGRIAACKISINANGSGGCDETVITVCENGYHDGTNDIAANPFDSALCFSGTTYRGARITACKVGGTLPDGLSADTVCKTAELQGAVCVATGAEAAPFDTRICGADDGLNFADVRQGFCRTNFAALKDSDCTMTISRFCDFPAQPNDIFDGLCDDGYDLARGTRCASAADNAGALLLNPNCGNEGTGYLATYCARASEGAPARRHCPQKIRQLALDACTNNRFGPACDRPEDLVGRIAACKVGGVLPEGVLESACTTNELQGAVCVATGTHAAPFDVRICGADDGTNFADVRQGFCRANFAALKGSTCQMTITRRCETIADLDNFNDALCVDFDIARGAYCAAEVRAGENAPLGCGDDSEANSLVRAYCTSGLSGADTDEANCRTSINTVCDGAPFGNLCTRDTDLTNRAVACRANAQGEHSCAGTIEDICKDGGVALSANPFDALCLPARSGTSYRAARITACKVGGVLPDGVLESACTTSELQGAVCVATGADAAPFDTRICGADDGTNFVDVRQTFCRSNLSDGNCTQTISRFCGDNANDIFDGLCNTGYDGERQMACANTANPAAALDLDTRCGDENSGLLATYCANVGDTAPARIHCPQKIRQLALDACTNNRFGTACDRPEDLVGRISACRSDLNANGSGGCDETVITVCERGYHDGTNDIAANPFDPAFCFDGTTYLAQRISACKVGGTLPAGVVASTACVTAELRDEVCVATGANADPLDTRICGADDGVILVAERQTFCRDNLADSRCTQTIARFCDVPAQPNDIFDTLCDEFGGINDARAIACIDDLDTHEDCADILAALIGPDPAGPILPSGGDEITAENWILALGARDVAEPPLGDPAVRDENDLNKFVADSGGLSPLVANFEIITLEGLSSLEGVVAGGVAIKSWNGDAVQTRSADQFAGILPATTVGAPITRTEGKAAWHGYMKIPERNFYRDFILDVDFETQKLEAIVDSLHFVHQYIYLTADFNDEGIISGRADYAHDFFGRRVQPPENKDSSVVSGIIGQGGAVAVFIGKQGYDGETGGFAATPVPSLDFSRVDFTDWIADFGYTPPPELIGDADNLPKAGFQTTNIGRLDTLGLSEITGNTMTIKTADTANNDSNLLADRSGVAYHRGKIDGTDKVISTAGVLDGTDLGAPLVGTPLGGDNIAIWKGHVEVLRGELFLGEPFDFIVDFNRRDIAAVPVLTQFHNLFVSGYWDNRGVLNGEVGLFSSFNGSIDTRARASLKGLIGQGGLVGAFASHAEYPDLETIIGGIIAGPTGAELSQNLCTHTPFAKYCDDEASVAFRIDACRNGTNGRYTCHHTIIAVCDEDPFDAFCYEGRYEDQYAPLRADACRFGTSGDNDCAPVVVVTCGSNPFDLLCYDDDTYVNARIRACRNDMHGGDDCAEEKPIICGPNPFYLLCTDEEYALERIKRCRDGTSGKNRCRDTIEEVCTTNPFDTLCDYSYFFRKARRTACDANTEADSSCRQILARRVGTKPPPDATNRVTTVDWLQSFNKPLATEANGYNRKSQYLIVTEDGLNPGTLVEAGGEQKSYGYTYSASYGRIFILSLAGEKLAGGSLGGAASSGVTFFQSNTHNSNTSTHYYGVLPNTDLGAPLASTYGRAEWPAIYQSTSGLYNDFTLIVNFDSAGIGIISANFGAAPDPLNYVLTGSFDGNGFIRGTMRIDPLSNGRPRNYKVLGLIGTEGAVAVHEGGRGSNQYSGGFVARSRDLPSIAVQRTFTAETITPGRVTTADWLGIFDEPLLSRPTGIGGHFLQATAQGADAGNGYRIRITDDYPTVEVLTMADHSFDGASLGGQKTDGVAFFDAWFNDRYSFYAGILSGTDLGAPLTQSSGSASWNGRFETVGFSSLRNETNFVLQVNFQGTAHGASFGTIETTLAVSRPSNSVRYFELEGQFDNHGVITGTVNVESTDALSESGLFRMAPRIEPGTLTGLIGAEGAVGAFYANNLGEHGVGSDYYGYAGGFVASPSAIAETIDPDPMLEEHVTLEDWVDGLDDVLVAPNADNSFQFIEATATGLNLDGIANRYRQEKPYVYVMTLANATFGDEYLGGDAADGVAFAAGNIENIDSAFGFRPIGYAGVLLETNLGAPVTRPSGKAFWKGQVIVESIDSYKGDLQLNKDLLLEVHFSGFIQGFVQYEEEKHLRLVGTFDSNGTIRGRTLIANFPNYKDQSSIPIPERGSSFYYHNLRGIIGQEGAVGTFLGYSDGGLYVGGFVAAPK